MSAPAPGERIHRPVPDIAVLFVEREEGTKLTAYPDVKGVWTIGTGHTPAHPGQKITLDESRILLRSDLAVAVTRLAACMTESTIAGLLDRQYGALLSFAFNEGADPEWKVWSAVPHGDMAVAAQLQRFVFAGKPPSKVDGLVNRRMAEIALYEGRDPLCRVAAAQPAPKA